MHDMSGLQDCVEKKIREQCFMSIVCEAFLGAVPIYQKDRSPEVTNGLIQYATEALADMGGYDVLTRAIQRETDPAAKSYLRNIDKVCMEAAMMVGDRVVAEHKDDPDIDAIADAANSAGMTQEEYSKFTAAAKRLAPDELSETIGDKVMDIVRAEKEAYQKDAETEQEIKAALKETGEGPDADKTTQTEPDITSPDPAISEPGTGDQPSPEEQQATDENAFESYGRMVMGRDFRPEHQTFFSSLQEMAMESLMFGKEKDKDLPVTTMGVITRRRTFPVFKSFKNASPMAALENLCLQAIDSMGTPDAPEGGAPTEDTQRKALLTASLIYTFFETLNTMNLYCPGLQDVRQVVDERISMKDLNQMDRKIFMDGMKGIIASATNTVRKATSIAEVDAVDGQLQAVREAASRAPGMESYVPQINQACHPIFEMCKTKREILGQKPMPAVESTRDLRIREDDTLKFSSYASTNGPKSNIHSFRCTIDPRKVGPNMVAVEGLDAGGARVGQQFITLGKAMEAETIDTYLTSVIGSSNLMKHDKPVTVVNHMTGKTYQVK